MAKFLLFYQPVCIVQNVTQFIGGSQSKKMKIREEKFSMQSPLRYAFQSTLT